MVIHAVISGQQSNVKTQTICETGIVCYFAEMSSLACVKRQKAV